ncbi:MAG: ATP-binding protein [Methanobrevibacter sp.]|jgi:AAA+ ATPase superfamily predicted ATPase|nr:ATP-binding protein [Candidatus Methanoflexus mossambicus]
MVDIPLGLPKDVDKYFYNREKELITLNSIVNTLNQNISNQILVTGLRGVGKSFLLKKLMTTIPKNILVSYIDISNIYGAGKSNLTEEDILYGLLSEMNNSLQSNEKIYKKTYKKIHIQIKNLLSKLKTNDYTFNDNETIFSIPIPQITENYKKLSDFVFNFPQEVVNTSKGKINGFIIIIDEFQLIGELKNVDAFFWLIRSFTQKQDNVTYIFTGSTSTTSEMVEKLNGSSGAFGQRMIQFNIEPFSKETSKNYLKEKIPEINFTDDGFERFYSCTRGYPANINSFCNVMSSNIIYGDKEVIKEFYNKLDQIAVKWISIWSSLNKKEKEIITTLIDNESIKWKDLAKYVSFSQATLTTNVKKLKNKGLISNFNKLYKIEDFMLSAWLKHRKKEDGFYPL